MGTKSYQRVQKGSKRYQNVHIFWKCIQLYSLPLSSTSKRGNFHLNVSARRNRSSLGEAIVSRGQKKRASTTAVLPFFNTIPRLLLRLKANFVGRAHFVLLSSFSLELRAEPKMIQLWKVLKSFVATFGFALSLMMTNNVSQQVLFQNFHQKCWRVFGTLKIAVKQWYQTGQF